uniref:Si:ch211-151o1.4 n=2 Tax=Sphaeramia orbicularis TaxID=375764 RepID=A0A673CNZ2_9TELE
MDRADRGRGKSRNPLKRISSPPTVFSHICEHQFGASAGGLEPGAGTQAEVLRGQMWPSVEPQQQQQQTQHIRLKKKFEDLKKRHVQDKEEWMREKESLLREVANIQGGENRRILLDLKTVLEEVQVEVKREEEKRSELELQYTRDRCSWELEKAELKRRIAQLESREDGGLVSGGVQAAAGPATAASRSAQNQQGETSTFRREREEQRRLLADTHSAAMDLRCRLEHNERDWLREKAELLERFDVERSEWESQLKDMQRKIEELYCEVRAKREGTGLDSGRHYDDKAAHRLSIRSTSTGSSILSDNYRSEPLSSSSQSEPGRHPAFPVFGLNRVISGGGGDGHHSTCFQAESSSEFNVGGHFTHSDHTQPVLVDGLRSRGTWQQDSATDIREAVDTLELDGIVHGAPGCGSPTKNASKGNESVHEEPPERPLWSELNYGSDKKKNTTALNAALKEIARVSEELCSYQDEIRKKSGDKRNQPESLHQSEDREMLPGHVNTRLELDEAPCDLGQIYDELRALERDNWITLSPDNTWLAKRGSLKSLGASTPDPDGHKDAQTCPGMLSEMETAPPIPPRTSSWNLSSPTHPDTELYIPESPLATMRKCHSPCVLVDRKCSSPSIVRKFEAMLQENEGKVLIDGVVTSCSVPSNSNCNVGCCHNRWSCDASKFTNNKLSTYGTVQKSFSEVNILTAGKELGSDYNSGVANFKSSEIHHMPPIVKEMPVDLLLSSLEIKPASPNLQGSRRNIMLEQKTAEFNRCLFQAEMGRGVEEPHSFTLTDASSVGLVHSATFPSGEVLPPMEAQYQQHCTDVTTGVLGVDPEVPLSLFASDSTNQKSEVQAGRTRCGPKSPEIRMKQENPSDVSSEESHAAFWEATTITSQNPTHHSEVRHKVQVANSPSRKTQNRAATEVHLSEHDLPVNTQPAQIVEVSSSKNENTHEAQPQPGRPGVSLQQPCAENKQRQMTQPGHQVQPKHVSPPSQSEITRPGPRVMNDHPWKPLTLAAYPKPEGSRSNYGAVERILKNYETAARAQQNRNQQKETSSSPNLSITQENVKHLDMLDMDTLPFTMRHTSTSHTSQTHTLHMQPSSHSATEGKEIQLTVQESKESSVSSSSVHKNFSRPARPANRRLPSRWASRSSASSSSSSSSPTPPSFALQKHASSSFTYSHAFHIETVII